MKLGGGGLGTVFVTILVADRLGFIKRKNGNGHPMPGFDFAHVIKAINDGNSRIVHQLERMNDKADINAREILILLNRKGDGI